MNLVLIRTDNQSTVVGFSNLFAEETDKNVVVIRDWFTYTWNLKSTILSFMDFAKSKPNPTLTAIAGDIYDYQRLLSFVNMIFDFDTQVRRCRSVTATATHLCTGPRTATKATALCCF